MSFHSQKEKQKIICINEHAYKDKCVRTKDVIKRNEFLTSRCATKNQRVAYHYLD